MSLEKGPAAGSRGMDFSPEKLMELNAKMLRASMNIMKSTWFYWQGMMHYTETFLAPSLSAARYFADAEKNEVQGGRPWESARDFMELLLFDAQLASKGALADWSAMSRFHGRQMADAFIAICNTLYGGDSEDVIGYSERQLNLMNMIVNDFPRAIRDIGSEYGLHLDNGGYARVGETERFELYQVLPLDSSVKVREDGKPVLIIPPYVLGANVLAFMPGENRSYIHSFANQGIPTYIRITKEIGSTPAVQLMSGEDDARDTRVFLEWLVKRHGRKVTLNGYCQGGFMAVVDLLSGELDGLVDALITCASPMDGSRSKSLGEYIDHLPARFRNLGYSLKTLPNGNKVVDGKLLSWVFKLKSIDKDAPLLTFYRDLMMLDAGDGHKPKISKTAAAVNHWLTYDRTDIPVAITRLSFDSYTKPVASDGTLPVKLFGRTLNFKRIQAQGIKWLICVAEKDDLVDSTASLAPLDYVDAEVSVFPKGHVAIATSCSLPTSSCALDSSFHVKSSKYNNGNSRGPVRFHLDMDEAPALGPEMEN